jgi:pyruvate,water dikinase
MTTTAARPQVVWLDDKLSADRGLLGGKFGSLAEMTAAELAVPPGFGITTAAYRSFIAGSGLADELRDARAQASTADLASVERISEQVAAAIRSAPIPTALEEAIRLAYAELEQRTGATGVPVAVRSSGESEDLEGASFAGQYDTFLWIQGADAVLSHVRQCWAGLFGPAVLTYRPEGHDLPIVGTDDLAMCVGVQQMVPARAAGVMFTLDPVTGDRSKIVIESCWGLGEGVVKGDITPDRYRVDKVTLEVLERDASCKEQEYRFDPDAGEVRLVPVEEQRQRAHCLDDDCVEELARLAKTIEGHCGAPQDIEWAVDEQCDVFVLQVRPETVWSSKGRTAPIYEQRSGIDHVLASFMPGIAVPSAREETR